jgi:hypothetical protein
MDEPKGIYPPEDGWKERTWYLVEVSIRPGNPIWKGLFYTGFLQDGKPSGYNGFFPANCAPTEGSYPIQAARYLKAVKELYATK